MFGATKCMMMEVCGGTSCVMMKVSDATSHIMMMEVGGGASRTITVCGATESILNNTRQKNKCQNNTQTLIWDA